MSSAWLASIPALIFSWVDRALTMAPNDPAIDPRFQKLAGPKP
jgi:hypothetical protein